MNVKLSFINNFKEIQLCFLDVYLDLNFVNENIL